ncbi:MAG: alpha/beta hydrolase [Gammaproteobacteria bacterium]|nr:MAG: alpha/beta hydrolase [Gammaproteobacteria bacterium]
MLKTNEYEVRSSISMSPEEFHTQSYKLWNNKNTSNKLICIHGVTRNSDDFLFLADYLKEHTSIACPDIAGRGRSQYLINPKNYNFHKYSFDVCNLAANLGWKEFNYLGTSMGGIVGMLLASKKNSPIKKLILNDIGPFVNKEVFMAVKTMIATRPESFNNIEEAVDYFKQTGSGFGPMTDDEIITFAKAATTKDGNKYILDFDQRVADRWTSDHLKDLDMWQEWSQIKCPVLIIRGADSPVLTPNVIERMQNEASNETKLIEIEKTGHAPHLLNEDQTKNIKEWLFS